MSHALFRTFFVLILIVGHVRPVHALAPGNDHFANAEAIAALPFSTSIDVSEATLEPEEPQTCLPADRTVWYTFVPASTMILIADAREGSGPKIGIFRAAGPGLAGLESVQCVSPGGAITFQVEQGQTYYIQVGAVVGEPGTVQFSLSEVIEIRGRIIDAATGAPLTGNLPSLATATLLRVCGDGCLEFVRAVAAFDDGVFRMDSFFGEELPPGMYVIEAAAIGYQTRQFGPFEFTGANLDVGDLALDPLAAIGSIRGRLLDRATGSPVPELFIPSVNLYRCTGADCLEFVNSQVPDHEGRFRFETDTLGNRLPVGTYQVIAFADQYHPAQTEIFEVGEGANYNVRTMRMYSFPVRFSDVLPCPDLPASGGECAYSVRIWNGLGGRLEGDAWSLASGLLSDAVLGFTEFQVKEPQELNLEPGKSRVVRFRFKIPAGNGSSDIIACARVFVGRGGNPFFNTVGYRDLFCVSRSPDGFTAAATGQTSTPILGPAKVAAAATEVEPNNTCQEAQEVGAVPFPFSMEGNLDSSTAPDIDFYRFRGTAGEAVIIDHEGQATGRGTLFDPLLGVFDSSCNLIAGNDDSGSLNSRVGILIPADGVFTLAATEYPDFNFLGGGNGTYQLTVTPIVAIGSISGRVTDASTGTPLPGDAPPFAYVDLIQCSEVGCSVVSSQNAGSDGSFYFTSDFNGLPLPVGTYYVASAADQYRWNATETFEVGAGENVDAGTLALTPFPIVLSDAQICEIPSEGGVCEFSITATNTLSTRFSGKAWSMIYAAPLGSFVDFTTFQTDTPLSLRLEPGESRTLHFRFRVRAAVPDGAFVCSDVTVGQNPDASFHPVGRGFPFCLIKGEDGLMLMAPQDAQAALHQMQLKSASLNPWFTHKTK